MHFLSSRLQITKIEDATYHFVLKSTIRQIDELIDSPKLLAMLGRESLQSLNGEPVSAADVVNHLDLAHIGEVVELSVVERVA